MDELVESTPVECQVGELAGVWSGWRILGDREVVREASAKGIHIKLAYKCLAYRMHCTIAEAQEYFNNEVCLWVDELLNKRQVFRATHVLNNTVSYIHENFFFFYLIFWIFEIIVLIYFAGKKCCRVHFKHLHQMRRWRIERSLGWAFDK